MEPSPKPPGKSIPCALSIIAVWWGPRSPLSIVNCSKCKILSLPFRCVDGRFRTQNRSRTSTLRWNTMHYIEFEHVYKTFDHPVLVDVNFHVDAGETLAIIGRSGVGKSVSLGHIMGFIKPDAGRIHVAYTDMTNESDAEWRRIRKKVTMVFQSGALFDSLTVGENILFSLELRDDYDRSEERR